MLLGLNGCGACADHTKEKRCWNKFDCGQPQLWEGTIILDVTILTHVSYKMGGGRGSTYIYIYIYPHHAADGVQIIPHHIVCCVHTPG